MTWRDNLVGASFRGATFKVSTSSFGVGRRNILHQYPFKEEPYAEDLGLNADSFQVEAYVIATTTNNLATNLDYFPERNALIKALKQKGPGKLVHPYLGEHEVILIGQARMRESSAEGGWARFSMSFVLAGKNEFPKEGTDPIGDVDRITDETVDTVMDSFFEQYGLEDQPWFLVAYQETDYISFVDFAKSTINAIRDADSSSIEVAKSILDGNLLELAETIYFACLLANTILEAMDGILEIANIVGTGYIGKIIGECSELVSRVRLSPTGDTVNETLGTTMTQELINISGTSAETGFGSVPSEILETSNDFLYLHLSLDEGKDTTAGDSSDFGNNGTLNNMDDDDWGNGISGDSLLFDGISKYLDCGNTASLTLIGSSSFTLSVWMDSDNVAVADGHLFGKREDANNLIQLHQEGVGDSLTFNISKGGVSASKNFGAGVFDSNPHHIVINFNRTTDLAYFFVDSILTTTLDISGLPADCSNTGDVTWGALNAALDFYSGALDEPRLYHDYNLISNDIRDLYLNPSGVFSQYPYRQASQPLDQFSVTTTSSARRASNRIAFVNMIKAMAITSAAKVAIRIVYRSFTQSKLIQDTLVASIDYLLEKLGDESASDPYSDYGIFVDNRNVYGKLETLRSVFVNAMRQNALSINEEKEMESPPDGITSLQIAYEQYADLSREDEVYKRNQPDIKHPGFFTGNYKVLNE